MPKCWPRPGIRVIHGIFVVQMQNIVIKTCVAKRFCLRIQTTEGKKLESEVEMQLLRKARVEDDGIYDDGIKYMLGDTREDRPLCVCSFECGRLRRCIE